MTRKTTMAALAAVVVAGTLAGCAQLQATAPWGWTTLIDGPRGLENFNRVGDANWVAAPDGVQASSGGSNPGYLVTRVPYRDFVIRAEFWASDNANSGIFVRCQNPNVITDESCYEANIFDQRPDPTYATGSIVKVAKVPPDFPRAGGKWNTYVVTAQGDHLVVELNGQKTVDVRDSKFANGPIALQWGRGTIKWRKVEIKPL